MRLLIVAESLAMCRLVRALIEELPVAVSECHDAAGILAACAETQPDWVLMDLTLAGGDALAVARQISALYPGTRILLLSQDDDPRLRGIAAKAGIWAMLHMESLIDLRRFLEPSAERSERTNHGKRKGTTTMMKSRTYRLAALAAGFLCGTVWAPAQVVGWGANSVGETNVPPGAYKAVAPGSQHALGLTSGGTVVA